MEKLLRNDRFITRMLDDRMVWRTLHAFPPQERQFIEVEIRSLLLSGTAATKSFSQGETRTINSIVRIIAQRARLVAESEPQVSSISITRAQEQVFKLEIESWPNYATLARTAKYGPVAMGLIQTLAKYDVIARQRGNYVLFDSPGFEEKFQPIVKHPIPTDREIEEAHPVSAWGVLKTQARKLSDMALGLLTPPTIPKRAKKSPPQPWENDRRAVVQDETLVWNVRNVWAPQEGNDGRHPADED